MNISNHPYNKHSSCYNFLFHPLHKKPLLPVLTNVFATIVTFGLWQLPFLVINMRDAIKLKKWKSNPQSLNISKTSRASSRSISTVQTKSISKTVSSSAHTSSLTLSLPKPKLPPKKKDNFPQLKAIPKGPWMIPQFPISIFYDGFMPIQSKPQQLKNIDPKNLDSIFLNLSLKDWIKKPDLRDLSIIKMSSPNQMFNRKLQIQVIETRIGQLNLAIKFTERLKKLRFPELTIKDILIPWEDSKIKYVLMMDDEFSKLRASDIDSKDSKKFFGELAERVKDLAEEQSTSSSLSSADDSDLRLVDMASLTAKEINKLGAKLHPVAFALIAFSELAGIDVDKLTDEQISLLFSSKQNVQRLITGQINACLHRVKYENLLYLTDQQIVELDYNKIDKEIFDVIFAVKQPRTKKLFDALKPEDMDKLLKYFEEYHRNIIIHEKIHQLDFNKFDRAIFNLIFNEKDFFTSVLLKGLKTDAIYSIAKFFTEFHWQKLNDDQILALDFAKIGLDKTTFEAIFVGRVAVLNKHLPNLK